MKKHSNHRQHLRHGVGFAVPKDQSARVGMVTKEERQNSPGERVVVKRAVSKIWTGCLLL